MGRLKPAVERDTDERGVASLLAPCTGGTWLAGLGCFSSFEDDRACWNSLESLTAPYGTGV